MSYMYRYMPNWIIKAISQTLCNNCSCNIKKKDIISFGVKNTENNMFLFIEYQCPECQHVARINFLNQESSIEDLCCTIIEESRKNRGLLPELYEKISNKTKISDTETQSFIKDMDKCISYDDFLKLIGASQIIRDDNNDKFKT